VTKYLSDEWFAEAAEHLTAASSLRANPGRSFVLQQVVTPPGAGTAADVEAAVTWHVEVSSGGTTLRKGRHPSPDVTFTCDLDTAWAVQRGELSAQGAFMAGRMRLGGDSAVLLANQELLAGVADVLAPLREVTTRA
jgi:hypothetical protein